MFEYVLDTFGEGSSLYDKQCDEFRLIGIARTKFGEVHILVEKVFFQFLDIRYFSNCDDGEAAEVGIDDNGLCICVADMPMPALPLNLSSSPSNLDRKYVLSKL